MQNSVSQPMNATEMAAVPASTWRDWHWQLRRAVRDIRMFEKLTGHSFPPDERAELERTLERFPLSITPYYLSLIHAEDIPNDPIFRQAFPHPRELEVLPEDIADPLAEEADSPVPGITHRYPDRVLFHVSNICSMYCRHCTRKRKVGDQDGIPDKDQIGAGIEYIRQHPEIRDVLLSGGDPLMMSDERLDSLLAAVRSIPHVEIIRIGSRMPAVLPYRITPDLIQVLRRHHPIWLNTHFNHPRELTASATKALEMLADGGIPLGNQSVLLAGVNDCPRVIKALCHGLVRRRVRPYYLYQCDLAEGLNHFRTPVGKGMEIMESLIGHTSGFARPTYVVDAPGGGGKIPLQPQYLISWSTHKAVLRNYEGVITTYREPDRYDPDFCNRHCSTCDRELPVEAAVEPESVGIERLLSDEDDSISLTPQETPRFERREQIDESESDSNS